MQKDPGATDLALQCDTFDLQVDLLGRSTYDRREVTATCAVGAGHGPYAITRQWQQRIRVLLQSSPAGTPLRKQGFHLCTVHADLGLLLSLPRPQI
jgi:hypothetical protein